MADMTYGTVASPGTAFSAAEVQIYYDKVFRKPLEANLIFEQCGTSANLPEGAGEHMKMWRMDNLAVQTTANASDIPAYTYTAPAIKYWTVEPLTYVFTSRVSEELDLKAPVPVLKELTARQGYQAAKSRDTIVRNALHTAFLNQFAAGAANELALVVGNVLNSVEIRKAAQTLRANDVENFEGDSFKALIHPAQEYDLLGDSAAGGIIDLKKYTDPTNLEKGVSGKLWGVTIMKSTNIGTSTTTSGATAYRSFVLGRDAFCVSKLGGKGTQTFRVSGPDKTDPAGLYTIVGWKMRMAAKSMYENATLNPRGIELYSCASV